MKRCNICGHKKLSKLRCESKYGCVCPCILFGEFEGEY